MKNEAGPKSESYKKTQRMTQEEMLRRGPCPEYFAGEWLGRDPEESEILKDCYREDPYTMYHEWPYRCEGVVFHNKQDCLNFAWSLSRNQDRDVWIQSPTGFPEATNWWSEERMSQDGTWDKLAAEKIQQYREGRLHDNPDVPEIGNKIDPPSRAEAQGRRKAYWDPKLKKTVITEEWEESSISPNRQKQIQSLKARGVLPEEPDTTEQHKAPNAS